MKKIFAIAAATAALTVAAQLPSHAETQTNYVGPAVIFGGGDSVFGAEAKFGVAKNISIRPVIAFASGTTLFGGSATYDFDLPGQSSTKFEPFAGIGFLTATSSGSGSIAYAQVGTDIGVSDSIVLTGDLKIPLSGGSSTLFGIGAGFKF
jgi:hypothetical protein